MDPGHDGDPLSGPELSDLLQVGLSHYGRDGEDPWVRVAQTLLLVHARHRPAFVRKT